jgi:hypothetical protein
VTDTGKRERDVRRLVGIALAAVLKKTKCDLIGRTVIVVRERVLR